MSIDNLIIDATNTFYKTFFIAGKNPRMNSKGERIESVDAFLNTVSRLLEKFTPKNVFVVCDKKLNPSVPSFRQTATDNSYKAQRPKIEGIEHLFYQEDKAYKVLGSLGIKLLRPHSLEADDVIGWLVSMYRNQKNIIVSSDSDFYQFVDENTQIWNTKELITTDIVKTKTGVPPNRYVLYKSIKGDVSDNIRGVTGYGTVNAARVAIMDDITVEFDSEQLMIVEHNKSLIDLTNSATMQVGELDSYEVQLEAQQQIVPNQGTFKTVISEYELRTTYSMFNVWTRSYESNILSRLISTL